MTKTVKCRLMSVIGKLGSGDSMEARELLEKWLEKENRKKPRKVTDFNRFVAVKMTEMKGSSIPSKDRLKECCRLWTESKLQA
jgi:hypothetical protein